MLSTNATHGSHEENKPIIMAHMQTDLLTKETKTKLYPPCQAKWECFALEDGGTRSGRVWGLSWKLRSSYKEAI